MISEWNFDVKIGYLTLANYNYSMVVGHINT